ncbi:MAG: hypothetical protein J6U54_10280 [Clostridiales bacterium]|nr:hypothetical protein [Clostridiales bacterium]
MGRFPVEGLTEFTEDDLEAMINTPNAIREKVGLEPVDDITPVEMKPGVQMIPAFDANYFEPGIMVTTYLVNEEGELRRGRNALICGYEDGLQTMKLNEPWAPDGCRPYTISIDDYISGRVVIKRMVEEEDHD